MDASPLQFQVTRPAGSRWEVRFAYNPDAVALVKALGLRWDPGVKCWWTLDEAKAAAVNASDRVAQAEAARVERSVHVHAAERAEAERETAMLAKCEDSRAAEAPADVAIPAPPGRTYLPFQTAGIAYAMARANVLIGDDMGLGKTVQAIGIMNVSGDARRNLVICPASLKLNWAREAERWLVRPTDIRVLDSKSKPSAFDAPRDGKDLLVIVNYDILGKHHASLRAERWDVLVCDEAHALKNPRALRTKEVLGAKPEKKGQRGVAPIDASRRVFLTGTPIVNRPIEMWPLVQALDPEGLGSHFMKFATRYCAAHQKSIGKRLVWDFGGASNLGELQAKARSTFMVRRLKADVLTDLPPKRRQVVVLPADTVPEAMRRSENHAWSFHEDYLARVTAERDLAAASGDDAAYASAAVRLRSGEKVAFDEMAAVRRDLAVAKIPAVLEHLESAVEGGKVIFFCHHHAMAERVHAHFGAASVMVHGGVAVEARQAAVDAFQTQDAVRVFVGTIRAAGVGLTLTAASHVVFGELDWVPGNVSQAEDRAHRMGQRNNVLVQHLVVDGSLDARFVETLLAKQAVLDAALDKLPDLAAPALPGASGGPLTGPALRPLVDPTGPCAAEPKSYADAAVNRRRAEIDAVAKTLSEDRITAAHEAMGALMVMDADRATEKNGMGFSKGDSYVGHELAKRPALTAKEGALALELARRYRGQLDAALVARIFS